MVWVWREWSGWERGIHTKIKSDRDVKEAIRSGYLTINGASPNRSLCLCSKRWMNTGLKIVGFPALCECIQGPKVSLSCEDKKRRRKGGGGRKMSTVFFFFSPFLHPRVIMDFVCTRAAWSLQFFFYIYFPKEKVGEYVLWCWWRALPRAVIIDSQPLFEWFSLSKSRCLSLWLDHQLPADSAGWWGGLECIGTLSI